MNRQVTETDIKTTLKDVKRYAPAFELETFELHKNTISHPLDRQKLKA